jgi:hypothetical protein
MASSDADLLAAERVLYDESLSVLQQSIGLAPYKPPAHLSGASGVAGITAEEATGLISAGTDIDADDGNRTPACAQACVPLCY